REAHERLPLLRARGEGGVGHRVLPFVEPVSGLLARGPGSSPCGVLASASRRTGPLAAGHGSGVGGVSEPSTTARRAPVARRRCSPAAVPGSPWAERKPRSAKR